MWETNTADEVGLTAFTGSEPPNGLVEAGITVIELDPYMAILSLMTSEGKRIDVTIERQGASYLMHALTDFLGADLDELRKSGN